MAAMAPATATFSGRTILYKNGGKMTVMASSSPFETEDPFRVLFVGWVGDDTGHRKEMSAWRNKAKEVIHRSW